MDDPCELEFVIMCMFVASAQALWKVDDYCTTILALLSPANKDPAYGARRCLVHRTRADVVLSIRCSLCIPIPIQYIIQIKLHSSRLVHSFAVVFVKIVWTVRTTNQSHA